MKKIGKELLRHGIWIVIVAVLLMKQCGSSKHFKYELNRAQQDVAIANNIVKETKDELGRTQTEIKTQEVEFKDLLDSKEESIQGLKDEVKSMGVRERNLRSVMRNTIMIHDTVTIPLHDTVMMMIAPPEDVFAFLEPDTIFMDSMPTRVRTFDYADKWLEANGNVYDDRIEMEYTVWEDHTILTHMKRNKWFGPRHLTVEFKSNNPNSVITNTEYYSQKMPRPLVSFGIDVGYGATFSNNSITPGPYVGVGAHFPIYTIYSKK